MLSSESSLQPATVGAPPSSPIISRLPSPTTSPTTSHRRAVVSHRRRSCCFADAHPLPPSLPPSCCFAAASLMLTRLSHPSLRIECVYRTHHCTWVRPRDGIRLLLSCYPNGRRPATIAARHDTQGPQRPTGSHPPHVQPAVAARAVDGCLAAVDLGRDAALGWAQTLHAAGREQQPQGCGRLGPRMSR